MPAGHPERGSRRRFDHAHRIREPVGSIDDRSARDFSRRSGIRPGAASAIGLLVLVTLALMFRPWDASQRTPSGDRPSGGVAAATPAPARSNDDASSPTLGPHGDLVDGGDAPDADIARWEDVRAAHAAKPRRATMLSGYRWPITNARITNSFGLGRPGSFIVDGRTFHDGIDISSFCGARITAAHAGVVLGAGRHTEGHLGWVGDLTEFRAKLDKDNGWGGQAITVVIDDRNGHRSIYAHLGVAVVERGEAVQAGDLLGYQGASGHATGCHLHYALFNTRETATVALDPKIVRKNKLPPLEIARTDPLLVLPPLAEAGITWGWGAR